MGRHKCNGLVGVLLSNFLLHQLLLVLLDCDAFSTFRGIVKTLALIVGRGQFLAERVDSPSLLLVLCLGLVEFQTLVVDLGVVGLESQVHFAKLLL